MNSWRSSGTSITRAGWSTVRRNAVLTLAVTCTMVLVACSNDEVPDVPLSIAATYHLKSIDGTPLPISSGGVTIDSGHVIRLGGDTVKVDQFSHSPPANGAPSVIVDALGTWRATEFSNIVVLIPVIAQTIDTAFISGDTLRLHAHSGGGVHVDLFVAP